MRLLIIVILPPYFLGGWQEPVSPDLLTFARCNVLAGFACRLSRLELELVCNVVLEDVAHIRGRLYADLLNFPSVMIAFINPSPPLIRAGFYHIYGLDSTMFFHAES
jgi:hypothetical protein